MTCVMMISTESREGLAMPVSALAPGARVTYLGYAAVVVHVFAITANIRFTGRSGGMSRQLDAPISALVLAA